MQVLILPTLLLNAPFIINVIIFAINTYTLKISKKCTFSITKVYILEQSTLSIVHAYCIFPLQFQFSLFFSFAEC